MNDIAERLGFLIKEAKFASVRKAADAYGIGYETLKKAVSINASEQRSLTPENVEIVARYHKVPAGWLMFNEGSPQEFAGIPLVGKIGAGQEMMTFEDPGNEDPIQPEIVGIDAVAFQVEGDSMRPLARDGDILFVGPDRQDIKSLIGDECAVLLEDGRRFFKIIENGSKPDRFNLVSYNAATIRNVEIHSAGRLIAIKRRASIGAKAGRQKSNRVHKSRTD